MFDRLRAILFRNKEKSADLSGERLSNDTIAIMPPTDVAWFQYPRNLQLPGIVHFGIGAFHRAHMAAYTDSAMGAGDRHWAIIGVSLRSNGVARQLNPQDGLYTLAERSGDSSCFRLIGVIKTVLVASYETEAVRESIAYPTTHIISFTITEKGYCRQTDGDLDFELAGESSVYRFLRDGLAERKARGLPGVTMLSCDNLAENGVQLQRLLMQYLLRHAPELADWVEANCTFPCSMVDRIVPATTAADLAAAQDALGWGDMLHDAAPVVTEPFSQWVIEDKFAGPRPNWQMFGAEFVADVAPYETAKLRMLNGAHSALAYLGLKSGYSFVHEAVADADVKATIETLMRDEATPTIDAAPGQDLMIYADQLIARFANPALNHRLIQIAMDGSQKIPQRWLQTLAWHQQRGQSCPAILSAIAAWIDFIADEQHPLDDPMAEQLKAAVVKGDFVASARALFGDAGLLPGPWQF